MSTVNTQVSALQNEVITGGSYADNTLSLTKQGGGSVDIPFEITSPEDMFLYVGTSRPVFVGDVLPNINYDQAEKGSFGMMSAIVSRDYTSFTDKSYDCESFYFSKDARQDSIYGSIYTGYTMGTISAEYRYDSNKKYTVYVSAFPEPEDITVLNKETQTFESLSDYWILLRDCVDEHVSDKYDVKIHVFQGSNQADAYINKTLYSEWVSNPDVYVSFSDIGASADTAKIRFQLSRTEPSF